MLMHGELYKGIFQHEDRISYPRAPVKSIKAGGSSGKDAAPALFHIAVCTAGTRMMLKT